MFLKMNNSSSISKRYGTIILIIVVLVVSISFCVRKNGFFEDEITSYGVSNSHYATWLWNVDDKYEDNDMTMSVIDKSIINKYITVSKDHTFDYRSTYINQTNDVHPPLYYMVLHTICSFSPEFFSKWQGLVPNLIFYYLTLLFIYLCINRICHNHFAAITGMLMYAVSNAGLETMLFIRMYCLLTLLIVQLAYLIIRFIQSGSYVVLPAITITIMLGMLTQYIFVYYAFSLCLVTLVSLLIQKQIKRSVLFSISALAGVVAMIAAFPYVFQQIRVGANSGSVSGGATIERVLDFGSYIDNFTQSFLLFLDGIPVIMMALLVWIGFLLICLVFKRNGNTEDRTGDIARGEMRILSVSSILSYVLLVLTNPVNSARYFYPLMALILVIFGCLISKVINKLLSIRIRKISLFWIIISAVILISLLLTSPNFLFANRKDYESVIRNYENSPSVYVTGDYYKEICVSALTYMRITDDTLILQNQDSVNSELANEYITGHKQNDKLLMYISVDIANPDVVVDSFMSHYHYTKATELFKTERLFVYALGT